MSIKEDFLACTDEWGLVQDRPGVTSDNGILFTAEAILALLANNSLDETTRQGYIAAIKSCQKEEGLYKRAPNKDGQEAPDDYYGLACASLYLESDMAKSVLEYGRKGTTHWSAATEKPENKWSKVTYNILSLGGLSPIKWVWNNKDPGGFSLDSYIGRQQNLVCSLQWAAGEEPPMWRKLWWCVAIMYGARVDKNNHDAWILAWIAIRTMNGKSWLCNIVANWWWKKFLGYYPEGMGSCLAAYFVNPNNPSARWLGTGK